MGRVGSFAVNTFLLVVLINTWLLGYAYRWLVGHGGSPCICFLCIRLGEPSTTYLPIAKRLERSARAVFVVPVWFSLRRKLAVHTFWIASNQLGAMVFDRLPLSPSVCVENSVKTMLR